MNKKNENKNWTFKSKKLESLFKEIYPQIKQNPNNFIIIKKWNRRLYNKYKFNLFKAIEEEMELQFEEKFKESLTNK